MGKFLSYKKTYRHEQQTIVEWQTVEVVDDGYMVQNKNGAKFSIRPFLKLEHFFGSAPAPEYPK